MFTAHTTSGAGRGKNMGSPTINLSLSDIPESFEEGVYVCKVQVESAVHDAVLHHGPRPVFHDSASCEVHILDASITDTPETVTIVWYSYLRPVMDFESVEELQNQIASDIQNARAILKTQ